jgi:hypothetical protein
MYNFYKNKECHDLKISEFTYFCANTIESWIF